MNPLVEQNDRFRRAADVEAEIPITAGPPIVRKWWVKRADYLAAPPRKLDDIIREVYGMELIRCTETGDATPSVPERQRYEFDTKTAAIAAAKEFYRKDLQAAAAHGQRAEKAEAGLRILEAA
jgi:hypothetical protein